MTYSSSLAAGRQRFSQAEMRNRQSLRSGAWSKNQNSTSFALERYTLGPISNTIILIVLACLLGLLYLTQVTKATAYGYKINALNQQQTKLQNEHQELQNASARLHALDRVSRSSVAKTLVSVAPSGTVQQ
ncbi:MAG TPA: hypothetical protein VJC09_02990 [Candidatus Saccharimonadales bacterium]|nr:hypothetical protein [Candidatus Saccharimonadales bacterium]